MSVCTGRADTGERSVSHIGFTANAPATRDRRASCDMRVFFSLAKLATFAVAVVVSGCDRRSDTNRTMSEQVAPTTSGSVLPDTTPVPVTTNVAAAERVLREYLDASRESTLDPATTIALTACGDGGQSFFPTTLLAGYTLLPFETRGDTVVGRAQVITVAEQDIDRRNGGRFLARQRVRHDILEWDVYLSDSGEWVVCNGLRFGYTGADSLTTWVPTGASYVSARRLADSILAVGP